MLLYSSTVSLVTLQQSADDVSQFDSKFTSQTPVDSPDDSTLSESANQAFLVTSYVFLNFCFINVDYGLALVIKKDFCELITQFPSDFLFLAFKKCFVVCFSL